MERNLNPCQSSPPIVNLSGNRSITPTAPSNTPNMKTLLKLTALAVLLPSAVIFAAEPAGEAKPKMSPFERADSDKDGKVSKEEFLALKFNKGKETEAAEAFTKADANKDGSLNAAELKAAMPKAEPKKKKEPKPE